jgi:hypothetical protein
MHVIWHHHESMDQTQSGVSNGVDGATTIFAILGSRNHTGPNDRSIEFSINESKSLSVLQVIGFAQCRHDDGGKDPYNRQVTNRFFPSGSQCGRLRS